MVNWTPTGFIGDILKVVGRFAPPPPGSQSPVRWGSEDTLAELFGGSVRDLRCTTGTVTQRFPLGGSVRRLLP